MEKCLFCQIVDGSIQAQIVYEDNHMLVFHDISPQAKVHLLLIPKKHIASMNACTLEDQSVLSQILLTAPKVAQKMGVKDTGYRLINNCGSDSGQLVFHLHWHLLGGENLGSSLNREKK